MINSITTNDSNSSSCSHDWSKYVLSIEEAAEYFMIGENSLRGLIKENPDAKWFFKHGNRTRIKRKLFEEYVDKMQVV